MVAPFDTQPGAQTQLSMDKWSGYPVARDRLLGTIGRLAPNRTVVLTGDIHSNWVSDLKSDFSASRAPVVAAELVGTSISSGGDGADHIGPYTDETRAENPHLKWHNARRGYFTCSVTPDLWRAEFRTVPFVSRPDAPVETPSRWRLTRGRPGIERE
jgi:alkaline phosphatase D